MHLRLRRECEEDYVRVGEREAGLDYRLVKIACSLEDGRSFRRRGWKGWSQVRRRGLKGGFSKVC